MAITIGRFQLTTVDRIRNLPTRAIAILAVALFLACGCYMLVFGRRYQLDLQVYRAAGRSLVHGGASYTELFTTYRLPFTYPPVALLVLCPLSFASIGLTELLWWLVNAAALVFSLYLLIATERFPRQKKEDAPKDDASDQRQFRQRSLAIATVLGFASMLVLEPVRSDIDYGQINLILMFLIIYDLTRGSTKWGGILVGVAAAIKLTPIVFLLFYLVRGDWRSLARVVSVFVFATCASWLVLPKASSLYWFHLVFDVGRIGQVKSVRNQSLNGLVHRLTMHGVFLPTVVWVALSLATLFCATTILQRLRSSGSTAQSVLVLAFAEVLVSPVSWTHHWSWLAIVPIVIVTMWESHRVVAWFLVVTMGVAIVAPYLWIRLSELSYIANDSLVIVGLATLIAWAVALGFPRPSQVHLTP